MSVLLQAPFPQLETQSVLPNPQFSNVENARQSLTIKRSMNNTKRTYVKSSTRKLLTFTFTLTRMKSLELRAFIESYYGSQFRLVDHEDLVWLVYFESNPFELNTAGRSAAVEGQAYVTITLNFEGVQQ